MKVLLLCDFRPDGPSTVNDHIFAIEQLSGHDVDRLSIMGDLPDGLNLNNYDAIILHYSLVLSDDRYVSPLARHRLRRYAGVKAVFLQDEYRWVNRAIDALIYIKATILFTCVPEKEIPKVYSAERLPGLVTVNVLTGYVPTHLLGREAPSYAERPIEIGYRGRRISAAFGQLGREKSQIAELFEPYAESYGLTYDISCDEDKRIYGRQWIEFIERCKAMLGVESGASVFDWDGTLFPAVTAAESSQPWLGFQDLADNYFPQADGLIKMNQISPRCFECAALKTLMVLYEGEYSGVLEPGRHYIPLKKDFSNIQKVVQAIRDEEIWRKITQAAYDEVACNRKYSFAHFGSVIGNHLSELRKINTWHRTSEVIENFDNTIADANRVVRSKTKHADTPASLHRKFNKYILSALPDLLVKPVNRLAQLIYQTIKLGWRLVAATGRLFRVTKLFKRAVGCGALPLGFYRVMITSPIKFTSDLEMLFRLQEFGRKAYEVSSIPEFCINYYDIDRSIYVEAANIDTLEPDNQADVGELINRAAEIGIVTIWLRCEESDTIGLQVDGIASRELSSIVRLLRYSPRIGTALIQAVGYSMPWIVAAEDIGPSNLTGSR